MVEERMRHHTIADNVRWVFCCELMDILKKIGYNIWNMMCSLDLQSKQNRCQHLHLLLGNLIFSEGIFPGTLKATYIKPLHKGGDRKDIK